MTFLKAKVLKDLRLHNQKAHIVQSCVTMEKLSEPLYVIELWANHFKTIGTSKWKQ